MKYYLGPWRWATGDNVLPSFRAPRKAIGAVDLGIISEMSVLGGDRKGCLCWVDDSESLGRDYDLLGTGDLREIPRSTRIANIFAKTIGTRPDGDTLDAMVLDCLIGQSDPDGEMAPMSIAPSSDGWMDLWMQGHGRVRGERFEWGRTRHTIKLKRQIRREMSRLMDDADGGKLRDKKHPRKVLDALCEKYGVSEWKEFIADARQKDIEGRLPHETTITDDFNRANSSSLGTSAEGWSWTTVGGDLRIVSNKASSHAIAGAVGNHGRAEFDLSSADHYAQATVDRTGSGYKDMGVSVRYSAAADTFYMANHSPTAVTLYKVVGGSGYTALTSVSRTYSASIVLKAEINGSTLRGFVNGTSLATTTDTSLTGSLRTGFHGYFDAGTGTLTHDDFEGSDLAPSGLLYTQLERSTRGLQRGMFTRWGSN
jgi:hypothetical protein